MDRIKSDGRMQAKDRIEELRRVIGYHDYKYYQASQPEISDYEYDLLLSKLKGLEAQYPELITPDSPTQRVAGFVQEGFSQVRHKTPMLSLDNTYSFDELSEFIERVKRTLKREPEWVCELKIDGVGVSLEYENGVFVRGATRGDGEVGDDITLNVKTIANLPLRLLSTPPDYLCVRGEVYLGKKGLFALNERRLKEGLSAFANTRNAAAGSLHLLDPRVVASRPLRLFIHTKGESSERFSSHYEALKSFLSFGLPVNPNFILVKNAMEIQDYCKRWEEMRETLDIDIDGVVVKVNSFSDQEALGSTSRSPRFAAAFKFKAERATTKLLDILIQVGRTGALTPVAILEPVRLSGVMISRATLHNEDEIRRKDIRVGDRVIVERSGDVIPKVIEVIPADQRSKPFIFPTNCPICGQRTERKDNEAKVYCTGKDCLGQLKKRIEYFAKRDCMDIEGLGEKVVAQLIDNGLISDLPDIYHLKKESLLELEGWQEKSATNLINAIEKSKERPLNRLISALGISHVGTALAFTLAEAFGSISKLAVASYDELINLPDIGPKVAESILSFFSQDKTKALAKTLSDIRDELINLPDIGPSVAGGILSQDKTKALAKTLSDVGIEGSNQGGKAIKGKQFVITGTLPGISRDEAKRLIESLGGQLKDSVSKRIDFLIVGESPGSKLREAEKLGIKIMRPEEFVKKISP